MSTTVSAPVEREAYVSGLDLAIPSEQFELLEAGELRMVEGEDSAYVDAGSTVSFIGAVSPARRSDILNSTLLAQLAANKKFDRQKQTGEWYEFYRDVLENLGWVITSFGFKEFKESGATIRMDKAALKVIGSIATGNGLAILTAALKALEDSEPDSKQVTLFDANGSSGEDGNFQLAACTQDESGNVETALGAFYFKATEHVGRFLFWTWKTHSLNFYFSAQSIVLNEEIYATVRKAVIDKLGPRAVQYVANLPI